jgi:hypothetical protein
MDGDEDDDGTPEGDSFSHGTSQVIWQFLATSGYSEHLYFVSRLAAHVHGLSIINPAIANFSALSLSSWQISTAWATMI